MTITSHKIRATALWESSRGPLRQPSLRRRPKPVTWVYRQWLEEHHRSSSSRKNHQWDSAGLRPNSIWRIHSIASSEPLALQIHQPSTPPVNKASSNRSNCSQRRHSNSSPSKCYNSSCQGRHISRYHRVAPSSSPPRQGRVKVVHRPSQWQWYRAGERIWMSAGPRSSHTSWPCPGSSQSSQAHTRHPSNMQRALLVVI